MASWTFTIREIAGIDTSATPVRHGFMVMLPRFSSKDIQDALPSVLSLAASFLPKSAGTSAEPLNVLHIGFAESGSANVIDEEESALIAEKQLGTATAALKSLDVRSVNLLLVNPGKKVVYFNFYSNT
jgi:hypothetical protein